MKKWHFSGGATLQMTETISVIAHRYADETLYYTVKTTAEDGSSTEKEMKGVDITNNKLINAYWRGLNDQKEAELLNSRIDEEYELPQPDKILGAKKIGNEINLLAIFPTLDTPVYVPSRILRNYCPDLVKNFYESSLSSYIQDESVQPDPSKNK